MQGDSISLQTEIRIYQTSYPMGSLTVPLHAAALHAPQGKLRINYKLGLKEESPMLRIHKRPPAAPLFLERIWVPTR